MPTLRGMLHAHENDEEEQFEKKKKKKPYDLETTGFLTGLEAKHFSTGKCTIRFSLELHGLGWYKVLKKKGF